tara:strand:+ start:81 stop:572 length:492 start_codon:yes stop_codon:yes gene_type:complete
MKLVINTQYRENYAAHNEDFVPGISENYWKFKGGSTYVVPNFTDSVNITEVMKNLTTLITYGNSGSEEYIIDYNIVDNNEKVCESWETVTQVFFNTDNVTALKVTDNREDGYLRSEILEKTEVWKMLPNSERQDYAASYLMQDGDIVWDNKGLDEWFTSLEAA